MCKNRGRGIIVKDRYFDFLCNIVDEDGSCGYDKLLGELHGIEFYSLIPNDDNRGEDGKQLRQRFIDEEGQHALSQSHLDECTVLEMLIGLSYRLEFETMSSRWEKTPKEWFWILIDNLGLSLYDDSHRVDEVADILKIFLDRHYEANGHGDYFHLRNPKKTKEEWKFGTK
jgi:hypothetical protein